MSFIQEPLKWNSVFRPVEYEYNYPTANFSSVSSVGGFAKFQLTSLDSYGYASLRRIYIASGIYAGWHNITAVTSSTLTTSTTYISSTTGTIKIIDDVQFEIYVGYTSGVYAAQNPERLIATIQPSPNLSAVLKFNIAEYLIGVWGDSYAPKIAPPANGVDVNMSTPFRVETLGRIPSDGNTFYAAYSTIPSGDLNEFDANGEAMSPLIFTCNCSIFSQIIDTVIVNTIVCSGDIYTDEIKTFEDGDSFEFQDGETYVFN